MVYPRPTERPDAVVEAIRARVERDGIDLVVPITDELLLPLAQARDRFAGLTTLAVPDPAGLAATHDKSATVDLAEQLGVAVPPTATVKAGEDVSSVGSALGYPVVVKPVASREVLPDRTIQSHVVAYAIDEADLRDRLAAFRPGTPVLLQRWLEGDGVGVELLMDRGRPLAAFQHLRLRGATHRWRKLAAGERRDRRGPVRRRCADARRARLDRCRHGRVQAGRDGVGYLMEIMGACGARSRWRSSRGWTSRHGSPSC